MKGFLTWLAETWRKRRVKQIATLFFVLLPMLVPSKYSYVRI